MEAVDGARMPRQRLRPEAAERQQFGVEPRRQVADRTRDHRLVVVAHAEAFAQETERAREVVRGAEQRLAVLDLEHARGAAVPFDPHRQHRAHRREVARAEPLAAVVVVEVLGARDQRRHRLRPVGRQGEGLFEADRRALRGQGRLQGDEGQQGSDGAQRGAMHVRFSRSGRRVGGAAGTARGRRGVRPVNANGVERFPPAWNGGKAPWHQRAGGATSRMTAPRCSSSTSTA